MKLTARELNVALQAHESKNDDFNKRMAAGLRLIIEGMLSHKMQEINLHDDEYSQRVKNLAAAHAEFKRTERR